MILNSDGKIIRKIILINLVILLLYDFIFIVALVGLIVHTLTLLMLSIVSFVKHKRVHALAYLISAIIIPLIGWGLCTLQYAFVYLKPLGAGAL